jgi:ferredoxin-NADP reductase
MSKIRYLTDLSWPGDIYLVFSVKTEKHIIFRDELDALRRRHANLHVTITLTRDDGAVWSGERGRITPALLTSTVPEIATRRVHICGPTEMTDPTRQMLRELGVPNEAIRVESFASPSRAAAADNVTTLEAVNGHADAGAQNVNGDDATITFARSRKTANPAGQTVLEAAEALRIAINYDCRAGICGQCKTKLLAGHVAMDAEDALDANDRANNVILACQARCVNQVVVDA